ncbi:unannotated protein [freshwater metagenome]|uniref:Unannotated protein n=1 Tax=freshwater metagenome TaxID=449393 RepID=A0A6J7F0U2_9ZZZZ|nr:hypothetical protein [Actinomycetota bacterium]
MLHTLWSVKGGSGVTLVSAVTAAIFARRSGRAVLVDLCGDQPAALGIAEPSSPGVRDWLASTDGSAQALERLFIQVEPGLWLLPCGTAQEWPEDRQAQLARVLLDLGCDVVVDAGLITDLGRSLASAGRSLLVTRPCYLALRRATSARVQADGVVVVADTGRALSGADVAAVLGLSVVASIEVDPAIARAVDAGLLIRRTHKALERSLRGVA